MLGGLVGGTGGRLRTSVVSGTGGRRQAWSVVPGVVAKRGQWYRGSSPGFQVVAGTGGRLGNTRGAVAPGPRRLSEIGNFGLKRHWPAKGPWEAKTDHSTVIKTSILEALKFPFFLERVGFRV